MTNNISENDPKLGQLLDSVSQDTPDLSHDELLALITKSEERTSAASMRQTTQRKNKGIAVMSIIAAIALVASYLIFSSPQQTSSSIVPKHLPHAIRSVESSPVEKAESSQRDESVVAVEEDDKPSKHSSAVVDPRRWEMFVHQPIDLKEFEPISVSEERLAALGLLRTDSGEVLYYHSGYKFGFPMYEYIRQFTDAQDPNIKVLGMRPFYAQYVTDSRGNMMMHYESKKINGGTSVMVGLYDHDLTELLKHIKYYANNNVKSDETFVDTIKRIYQRQVLIRQGVMICDTLLDGKLGDEKEFSARINKIISRLRVSDSTYKMNLGGMDAIARDYVFDMEQTGEPIVQRVLIGFKLIDQSKKTALEKIADKIADVERLMVSEKDITWRLRLEQLSTKLQYDAYVEQSKLEAAALANPVDLVAITIRPSTGLKANPKLDNGLIFWYRDSDSLREVLGQGASVKLETSPKIKMSVMPNPAMLYLYVNYDLEEAAPLRLTLADITGKQVYTDAWKAGAGSGKKEINVQQFPNGIYMLVLDSDRGRTTRQVIIQHQ